MGMAFGWFVQGAAIIAVVVSVVALRERWARTRSFVMLFPGATAMTAYLALESLPMALGMAMIGIGLMLLGLAGLGAAGLIVSVVLAFIASCAIGLCLPNLGIERLAVQPNS
jgi:hypothetical protein